jgi:hypothetical protein
MKINRSVNPKTGKVHYTVHGYESKMMPEELFFFVDNEYDAHFITNKLNSETGRQLRRARLEHVLANGIVDEAKMPGTREALADAKSKLGNEIWAREVDRVKAEPPGTPPQPESVEVEVAEVTFRCGNLDVVTDRFGKTGHVLLDGQPVRGVQKLTIECGSGCWTKVTFEMTPSEPKPGSDADITRKMLSRVTPEVTGTPVAPGGENSHD